MKQLTKAEEQIMHVLWELKKAYVREILDRLPEPKPAYNTVSTIVRILEKKEFVGYKAYGKSHEYFPIITKKEYRTKYLKGFVSSYFDDSLHAISSFFSGSQELSLTEMEKLRLLLDKEIEKKKSSK